MIAIRTQLRQLRTQPHQQRGNTLMVGLVMLVLMTLMAVSAINTTSTNVQVVGNAQFREEANAAAQQAIESVISTITFTTAVPAARTIGNYTVTFNNPAPSCRTVTPANQAIETLPDVCVVGAGQPPACYWTIWDITARVDDATTGASTVTHQGVRLLVGLNSATASCGV